MSRRKNEFANGEFYHVYNRGVDKRNVYIDAFDVGRFLDGVVEFNTVNPIGSLYENSFRQRDDLSREPKDRLVNVIAYCLNPNHFHFILEQREDGGISEFMKRLGGYSWYFNNKYKRNGSLFQGRFKAKHIDSNEYLLHVSAYVNLNHRVHKLGGPTPKSVGSRSSWPEYIGNENEDICEKQVILEQFRNVGEYEEFALSSIKTTLQRRAELESYDALLLE